VVAACVFADAALGRFMGRTVSPVSLEQNTAWMPVLYLLSSALAPSPLPRKWRRLPVRLLS